LYTTRYSPSRFHLLLPTAGRHSASETGARTSSATAGYTRSTVKYVRTPARARVLKITTAPPPARVRTFHADSQVNTFDRAKVLDSQVST